MARLAQLMTVLTVISIILVSARVGYKVTGTRTGAWFGGIAGGALSVAFLKGGGFPKGFANMAKTIAIGLVNVVLFSATRSLIEDRLDVRPLSDTAKKEAIVKAFAGGAWASLFPFTKRGVALAGSLNSIILGWRWRSDRGIIGNLLGIGTDAIIGASTAYIAYVLGLGIAWASNIEGQAFVGAFAEGVTATAAPLAPTVIGEGAKELWKEEDPESYSRIYGE